MKYKYNLIITLLLSIFFVSCSQSSQDLKIHIPYLDDNILEWQEYIPYEDQERELEDIWDEYILRSTEWYTCDNIQELGRFSGSIDISLSTEFSNRFCDDWNTYRWHTVISFVYYDSWYESLPRLWYKMLFFHPEKWYIDYVIPEDELVFEHYADIQLEHIEKKVSQWAEFPNEKWSQLYDYMDTWFKKDFTHDNDVAWIVEQERFLGEYTRKYSRYSWNNLIHSNIDYNCSNLFGLSQISKIKNFRQDLCNTIELWDRKLIYLLYLSQSYMTWEYWIVDSVYLIDEKFWYISPRLDDFKLSRFLPEGYERYRVLEPWIKIEGDSMMTVYWSTSYQEVQEIDNKIFEDIYADSPEIEQEFQRLEEYVKENYITTNQ